MKKLSLVQKIGGGFGIILVLVLIVATLSWNSLNTLTSGLFAYTQFVDYGNTNFQIQDNMMKAQMNVKDFIISGDQKSVLDYENHLNMVEKGISGQKEQATNPERKKELDVIIQTLAELKSDFQQIISLKKKRAQLFNENLAVLGTKIAGDLGNLMDTANNDRDDVGTYLAGMAIRNLLLGRIYVFNFLDTGDVAYAEKAEQEFIQLDSFAKKLSILLPEDTGRETAASNREESKQYLAIFKELVAIIQERDRIAKHILEELGPTIIAKANASTKSINSQQTALGGELASSASTAKKIVFFIAVSGLVFGVFIAFWLTTAITKPILRTANFAEILSKGDFSKSLDIVQEDEIGKMSESLNRMINELRTMLKDIIGGIHSLADNSKGLKNIASEMSINSDSTSQQASMVATAAEEMSINMNSIAAAMEQASSNTSLVASATDEMTGTVDKISAGAERAREISSNAVNQAVATSEKVEDLGTAASKIGRVTETITEISDQTNLLALNATIEAARAGEAGKGFAVVANEIKELAKQTAEATVDIKNQIDGMQNTTSSTIEDIHSITEIINEVNSVINDIHIVVKEQEAVTGEISENITQSSLGIAEVNENVAQATVVISDISKDISGVNTTSSDLNRSSSEVEGSADKLAHLAETLEKLVNRFKV